MIQISPSNWRALMFRFAHTQFFQAIIDSLSDTKADRASIAKFTRAVFFFATPHRGASNRLVKFAKRVLTVIGSENLVILQVLDQKNIQLEQLHTNFMSATKVLVIESIMSLREVLNTPGLGRKFEHTHPSASISTRR